MADDQTTDRDDLDTEEDDDGLADVLAPFFKDADEDEDTAGLDAPSEPPAGDEKVSDKEGQDLVEQARDPKAKRERADAKTDSEADEAAREEEQGDEEGSDAQDKAPDQAAETAPEDLTAADTAKLLDGLDGTRKAEVERRLNEAYAPFATESRQKMLQSTGVTPAQATERLLQIYEYAQDKGDEYAAWFISQTGNAEEVLTKAAERLGYTVSKAESDDDLFEDDEKKEMRAKIAELEAKVTGGAPQLGPDTPERVQQRQVEHLARQVDAWVQERDPATGQPLRPHWDLVQSQVQQRAIARRQQTGQPVTLNDLDAFYSEAVGDLSARFGGNAAQGGQPVAGQTQEAAAAQRALRASKSVDGTGQSASRRPALSPDASLDEVIRHNMREFGF